MKARGRCRIAKWGGKAIWDLIVVCEDTVTMRKMEGMVPLER